MPNKPTIRWYSDIGERTHVSSYGGTGWAAGTYEMQEENPIHFAGACLFVANSSNSPVTIHIDQSTNRTTWTPVLFSTHTTAGNLAAAVAEQSFGAFLFVTNATYVRFRATNAQGEAVRNEVFFYLAQYPPERGRGEGVY